MTATLRVVPVPKGAPVFIESTADPSIWLAHSRTHDGRKYRVGGIGTANPWCNCQARVQCAHITAVLAHVLEKKMQTDTEAREGELMDDAPEPTSAVVPFRPAATTSVMARQAGAASAQSIALTARGSIEGYKEYLYLARELVTGGLVPNAITPQAAAAMMLKASELGVPPMAALELFYVVGNKVAIQGQMVAALIERSGRGFVEIVESTNEHATVIGHREGRPPMTVTWTREMATTAGSKNMGGWADKLVWKAIARIGRRMFADVLGGMDVGDGQGVIIDYGIVPEQEGEYIPPVVEPRALDQPAPEPPAEERPRVAYEWAQAFQASWKESGIKPVDMAAYLEFDGDKHGLLAEIDRWLSQQPDRTPRSFMSTIADWIANGRPPRPKAPEPEPPDTLFDFEDYTESLPTTDARGNH